MTPERRRRLLGGAAALVLLVEVLIIVAPTLGRGAGFLAWDDDRFLAGNPLYKQGGWSYVAAALTRIQFEAYQPLHLLSYLPDRLLWRDHPGGYHLFGALLFWAALVVFLRLLEPHVGTRAAVLALAVFAAHPLVVEPVVWITSRKDVLGLFFVALALLAADRSRPVATLALGACALLCKSATVGLPVAVAAWLWFVRGADRRRVLIYTLPLAVLAAADAILVYGLWRGHALVLPSRPLHPVVDVAATLGLYAARVLVPIDLAPIYPATPGSPSLLAALGAALAITLVVLVAGPWRSRLSGPWRFALVAAAAAYLPIANLVPVYFRYADRYLFLSLAFLSLGLASTLDRARRPALARGLAIAAVLVAVAGVVASHRLARSWRTSEALFARNVDVQPRAYLARLKYGETLRDLQRWDESVAAYETAIFLDPDDPLAYAGVFFTHARRAEVEERLAPGRADAWLRALGGALRDLRSFQAFYREVAASGCDACARDALRLGRRRFAPPRR